MKVAFTIGPLTMAEGAGLTAAAAGLGRALVRGRQAELTVFGTEPRNGIDPEFWKGATLVTDGRLALRLDRRLTAGKYDIVHSHGLWLGHQWGVAKNGRRLVRVVSIQGHLDAWAMRRSSLKKKIVWQLFQKRSLRTAACLHALHEGEVAAYRAKGLSNPICVIPNGIDEAGSRGPDSAPWRSAWPEGGRTLLFMGRIGEQKGAVDLIKAWADLALDPVIRARGWKLVLAGWPEKAAMEKIVAWIAKERLRDCTCVLGPQLGQAKASCLAQADAFVLPSRSEGLPMAVLEAWSYGLPVAMTAACNLPIGFARKAAFEITLGPAELRHSLKRFLSLPDEAWPAMGAAGLKLTRTEFSWDAVATRMAEVYRWCLRQGPPPATLRYCGPMDPAAPASDGK